MVKTRRGQGASDLRIARQASRKLMDHLVHAESCANRVRCRTSTQVTHKPLIRRRIAALMVRQDARDDRLLTRVRVHPADMRPSCQRRAIASSNKLRRFIRA
jgi:hypothetical protein